ncbi:MAG: c-type cytochrome [Flavobacteriaceae bacterium]
MRLLFSFLITALSLTSFNLYQQKPLEQSIADGKEIYADFCLQCHMAKGEGVKGAFPPLANSDYLKNIDQSIHAIKYGLKGPIKVNGESYNGNMITQGLDEEEIADVMNYILNSWGNSSTVIITEEKVASIKK